MSINWIRVLWRQKNLLNLLRRSIKGGWSMLCDRVEILREVIYDDEFF
jgi:hypothetical protein